MSPFGGVNGCEQVLYRLILGRTLQPREQAHQCVSSQVVSVNRERRPQGHVCGCAAFRIVQVRWRQEQVPHPLAVRRCLLGCHQPGGHQNGRPFRLIQLAPAPRPWCLPRPDDRPARAARFNAVSALPRRCQPYCDYRRAPDPSGRHGRSDSESGPPGREGPATASGQANRHGSDDLVHQGRGGRKKSLAPCISRNSGPEKVRRVCEAPVEHGLLRGAERPMLPVNEPPRCLGGDPQGQRHRRP